MVIIYIVNCTYVRGHKFICNFFYIQKFIKIPFHIGKVYKMEDKAL